MKHQMNWLIFTCIVLGSLWLFWQKFIVLREGDAASDAAAAAAEAAANATTLKLQTGLTDLLSANGIDIASLDASETGPLFTQLKSFTSSSIFTSGTAAATGAGAGAPAGAPAAGAGAGALASDFLNTTPYKEYPEQTFFTGKKFSDAFGTTDDCSVLNIDSCNDTGRCIWLKSNRCVSGSENGPLDTSNLDAMIDYDYYSFKNTCYGNCNVKK
jgi:hypothetical protein